MLKKRTLLSIYLLIFTAFAEATPQKTLAVVEENSDRISFYNTESGAREGSLKIGFLPHEITVTKDGKTAYISNFGIRDYDSGSGFPGTSISVIDLPNQVEKYRLFTFDANDYKDHAQIDSAPHGVKLRPPFEKQLYVNVEQGAKLLVYDVDEKTIIKKIPVSPHTHNLFFSEDGKTLWLMAGKDGVIRMDPDSGTVTGQFQLGSAVRGLKYTPDGRSLMVSGVNHIVLIDPDSLEIKKNFTNLNLGAIIYSEMTPDQKYILAPAPFDHQVAVIDVASQSVIKRLVTGLNPMNVLASPDGQFAYVSNATDRHLSKIDLKTLEYINIPTHAGPNGLAFVPKLTKKLHKKLRLGVALPLSGKDSQKGKDMLRGYEYWRSTVMRAGGIFMQDQVFEPEIIYLDTESQAMNVEVLTKELLDKYQVDVLLSTFGQEAYQLQKAVAESRKIILTPSAGDDSPWEPDMVASGYDYFVSTWLYEKGYVDQYNFKPTIWSARASALGLQFQQTCLLSGSLDYQPFTALLNETEFNLFIKK